MREKGGFAVTTLFFSGGGGGGGAAVNTYEQGVRLVGVQWYVLRVHLTFSLVHECYPVSAT